MAAALVCSLLAACTQKAPADQPEPEPVPPAWWELLSWDKPHETFTGKHITARVYDSGRASFTLDIPAQGDCDLWVYTGYGRVDTVSLRSGVWSGAQELAAKTEGDGLTLMLQDKGWDLGAITALKTVVRLDGKTTEEFYRRGKGKELEFRPSSISDFSLESPKFRYVKLDSKEEWVVLALYRDDTFLLSAKENGLVYPIMWGKWDDGNTAITFWPDEQCCGPGTEFRLEKTGGLRVYEGGGPPSLPIAEGDAFLKVGDMLDFDPFDSAVVSMVVDGDRPAIFLNRESEEDLGETEDEAEDETGDEAETETADNPDNEAKTETGNKEAKTGNDGKAEAVNVPGDEELLEAFREMMLDAVELTNPRWTEDPEDRPNIQFDLNINGEDITMVLCPCIVADTEDKYLLVQKDSYMGRVTYTYYQTRQGDDYDRMCELFNARYEADPQVMTAAMAAQTRALTSAISNLDWSEEFPLDENGIPIEYNYVLREQRATGYSSRSDKAYGAGSRTCEARTGVYYCTAGTVAVRASQIPYGTKLYIRTQAGGFIYGYAVANDTGTALEEGIIDIDLFYDSYQESVLNSVRWVDVYVLD